MLGEVTLTSPRTPFGRPYRERYETGIFGQMFRYLRILKVSLGGLYRLQYGSVGAFPALDLPFCCTVITAIITFF